MRESLRAILVDGAMRMGVGLDEQAVQRFAIYFELLKLWGKKINLTARREDEEVVIYHFLDSLAGIALLAATPEARLIDIGSGAGLPSLPLKFALPGLNVVLVDSVRKKIAFCREAIRSIGIAGAEAVWGRGEDLGTRPERKGAYDWVVSRALGQSADVARLALPFLAPGGRILLYKGAPSAEELQSLDIFCAEHGAVRELRPATVPHLKGSRTLIVVGFPEQNSGSQA